jgi:hypothetical protein
MNAAQVNAPAAVLAIFVLSPMRRKMLDKLLADPVEKGAQTQTS